MPEIEVRDKNNNTVEKLTLRDEVFGVEAKTGLLHEAVMNYLANHRQGTHATKTKGLVRGGGRKPWRQKHTGRSRSGSIRSPIWRGGGITFGPQPRDYSYKLPKKVKRLALMTAVREKLSSAEMIIVDKISFESPNTKNMIMLLKNLNLEKQSVLIVLPEKDDTIGLSARNIPGVHVTRVSDLNTFDVLTHAIMLMTKKAALSLEESKET
jgi:large subunit ribosomal protein L4